MSTLEEVRRRGTALHAQGKLPEALEQYDAILRDHPEDFDTLLLIGVLQGQLADFDKATDFLSKALQINPNHAVARINLGRAYLGAGKVEAAFGAFDEVLKVEPSQADALLAKGSLLLENGRLTESIECYDRLLQSHPKHSPAWLYRGNALWELGDVGAALASYQKAREADPTVADHHLSEGEALLALNRDQQAREAFDRAVQINPNLVEGHLGRASALIKQRNIVGALVSADRARQLQPNSARAYCLLGCGQFELGHLEPALEFLNVALQISPSYAEAQFAKGEVLQHLGRYDEAATAFAAVIESKPAMHMAYGHLLHNRMRVCDWRDFDLLSSKIISMVETGSLAISSFALQGFCDDPVTLEKCARNTISRFHPRGARSLLRTRLRNGGKFRIGFLGSDFGESPLASALEDVWRSHDPTTFELVAIDSGFDDGSNRRKRLAKIFSQWVVVTDLSDVDAALRIASLQLDLLIDLNGFQGKARPGIFALRPVRLQARFMGFPGTLGADYLDYFITDAYALPADTGKHFSESIIYLPDCAKPVATVAREETLSASRTELGLPENARLLASNADAFKITPAMFGAWMRVLGRVPGACLWILRSTLAMEKNLRLAAESAGIDPTRLYFSEAVSSIEAFASRVAVADLLLDTSPFSDSESAGIALASGVPALTLAGKSMGSRQTASLLASSGMTKLIADNLDDYEEKAVAALSAPMHSAKNRAGIISEIRKSTALNPALAAKHLESAYRYMIERAEQGLPPAGTHIDAIIS